MTSFDTSGPASGGSAGRRRALGKGPAAAPPAVPAPPESDEAPPSAEAEARAEAGSADAPDAAERTA
ncbi:segregation/condensation protein A, partial [Streptomyces scabiei]|nr:segregation/condensation protein A [Streptomyces scabiei]